LQLKKYFRFWVSGFFVGDVVSGIGTGQGWAIGRPHGLPQSCQWPAEAFRKNLQICNLLLIVWGFLCFVELLVPHKSEFALKQLYKTCTIIVFIYFTILRSN